MSTPPVYTLVYTADLIRSFNTSPSPPCRLVRKTLFSFKLWRPAHLRSLPCPSSDSSRSEPCRPPPSSSLAIRLATLNIRSLKNKYVPTADMIVANDLDVLVVVESWHLSSTDVAVRRAAPPGFQFLDRPRADDTGEALRGGGLVVYHRNQLRAKRIELARTRRPSRLLRSPCRPSMVQLRSWPYTVLAPPLPRRHSSKSSWLYWNNLRFTT